MNGDSVGLSSAQYAQGRRRMLDLVNRLHSTGFVHRLFTQDCVSHTWYSVQIDIDLPVIAVIGSQSAGKVSVNG
jgi:methenyltetrahydromethanopterin cyclohydrolase